MFTASHNPATYNGIKLEPGRRPGDQLENRAAQHPRSRAGNISASGVSASPAAGLGEHPRRAARLRGVPALARRAGGHPARSRWWWMRATAWRAPTVPAVLGTAARSAGPAVEIVPLYFELDGTFPNHEANPLDPKNLLDLQRAVVEHGADLGLAFDGDADRCFVIDERGELVEGPPRSSPRSWRSARSRASGRRATPRPRRSCCTTSSPPASSKRRSRAPGQAVRTRAGHSYIKDQMAQTGAIFGGEHSAHYYFRDFWGADNGMLAAMQVIAELGQRRGSASSELGAKFTPYPLSGEINSVVRDIAAAHALASSRRLPGSAVFDELDGLDADDAARSLQDTM